MQNTATQQINSTNFSYIGNESSYLEKDNITIHFWGTIQNISSIIKILNQETSNNLKNISAQEIIFYGYKQWGMGLLNHIKGAYCFVLHNNKKDTIFIARDSLGISNIYYTNINNHYYFSENPQHIQNKIKNPTIKENLIQHYLATGYTTAPNTLIEDVYKVPAATWLQIKNDTIKHHTYWYPINNSYSIQNSDIHSFKAVDQAVKNKLGNKTFSKEVEITPKLLFKALKEQKITSPIGDLYDFVTAKNNMQVAHKEFFISSVSNIFCQKLPSFIQKLIYSLTTRPFSSATIPENEVSALISPFIKDKQTSIASALNSLNKDFKSQPKTKQTQSNWFRSVYLAHILPEKTGLFISEKNEQILNNELAELMIGLPEKISLKIPKHIENMQKIASRPPLEEWFFKRYEKQSYELVIEFCNETQILAVEKTKTAWKNKNFQLNWRLISLAMFWQASVKHKISFLK